MFPRPLARAARSGFSLLELVLTMTIITILVGVVSLRAGSMNNRARAAKIISLVDSLKPAVILYYDDTGQLPREYDSYQGATYHRLSLDPGINGWRGPYIEAPINRSWNPMKEQVNLYASAATALNNDFDLDGNGDADVVNHDACCLSFWGVDETLAAAVDREYDRNVSGLWTSSGRVEYDARGQVLTVLVFRR